ARGIGNRAAFRASYEVLGAQRNAKILGVFSRLWKRDGKPGYRQFQPRVWRYLERNLAHPALEPVRAWFDANLAADQRAAAWKEAA
ncbi:MAG: aminoglycoside phosphotransferase, partial [Sphingomonadaceae bacterium]|nr:aminoglycoside phosphotransferase [Sphingomonadaceae bacterium]